MRRHTACIVESPVSAALVVFPRTKANTGCGLKSHRRTWKRRKRMRRRKQSMGGASRTRTTKRLTFEEEALLLETITRVTR